MLKTRLTEMLGIKHPIIQAGMGPFSNNNLGVASANAGVLGLLSTSGLFNRDVQPLIYEAFVKSGEASMDDDIPGVLETVLKRTYRLTKDQGGIFGINVMVSAEIMDRAKIVIDTARAPYHAREFISAEFAQNKDGEFITAYPDKDNHSIDDTRYATNLIWRQIGA